MCAFLLTTIVLIESIYSNETNKLLKALCAKSCIALDSTGSKSAVISNTSSDTPLFFSSSLLISTGSSVSTIIFVTVRIFSSFLTILLASGEKIISYLSGIRRFFEYVFVQTFLLRIFLI